MTRLPTGGGKIKGRFDDAAIFAAIAAVIDAKAGRSRVTTTDRPGSGRPKPWRTCAATSSTTATLLPECGGQRPHVNVLIRLEDLQNRARAACLDFGGPVAPESLRMLCCDAAVVPIVMNGKGHRSMSGGPPARSLTGYAAPSPPVTADAHTPGATARPPGARSIMSWSGRTAARPV